MSDKKKVLAIIPARGGSKGVPRKNIKLLCGKPLIAYAIHAALDSGVIDRLVVSTDDEAIARVARKHGAEVPFMRPAWLATDKSLTEPAMTHAVEELERMGYSADYVALIQCTSPLITPTVIRKAIRLLLTNKLDSCLTVGPLIHGHEFRWDESIKKKGIFVPAYDLDHRPRRQDSSPVYIENGALYMTRTHLFKKTQNRVGGKRAVIGAIKMNEEDSMQIDSSQEFFLIERILKMRLKIKKMRVQTINKSYNYEENKTNSERSAVVGSSVTLESTRKLSVK